MRLSIVCLPLIVSLSGCRSPSPEKAESEAQALRASIDRHRAAYLKSIQLENALVARTLTWLSGPVATRDRGELASEAGRYMEDWARVYFMPREMHAAIKQDEYSADAVCQAHEKILKHLKDRYFILHDYQRYAQYTSESDFKDAPPGRMPSQLAEMKRRLETHAAARDEITPILAQLP
jgi:hypothetical protein